MRRWRNGDRELRALGRAVKDDPSDLNAYIRALREKLRAGLISHDRLVMAARLGHAAAQGAAPEWVRAGAAVLNNYGSRREAISILGNRREMLSFACDCAERVLPVFEHLMPGDERPRLAIEAARAEIMSSSIASKRVAKSAGGAAVAAASRLLIPESAYAAALAAAEVAWAAAHTAMSNPIDTIIGAVAYAAAALNANAPTRAVGILWQQEHLSRYLLREVSLPTPHATNPRRSRRS